MKIAIEKGDRIWFFNVNKKIVKKFIKKADKFHNGLDKIWTYSHLSEGAFGSFENIRIIK